MIERWSLVSDGKRYHNMQRDMQGEYVMYADHERDIAALKNLVINRVIELGSSVLPETPFNRAVDLLILTVEKRTADRCKRVGVFAPEVVKAAEELASRFPHGPTSYDEQAYRTAQVIQEVLDRQNVLGAGIGMDGKVIS